jgi:histone-lysine N-methyltransferase SETD7
MGEESDVIDVPISFIPLANYSASLGHKANHSSRPNAAYVPVFHPRFGDIKCVRMLSSCPSDAEVTVDYGYDGEHGFPDWWQG